MFCKKQFFSAAFCLGLLVGTTLNAAVDGFNAYTTPLADGETITVDGQLNDPVWKKVKPLWLQEYILPGQKANVAVTPDVSKVFVTKNGTTLYIGFDFADADIKTAKAPAREKNDKGILEDNSIAVFLCPGDDKTCCQFIVSSAGACSVIRNGGSDKTEPKWEYKVNCGAKGWTGEIAIPLSELGVKSLGKLTANFMRVQSTANRSMRYTWSPFLMAESTNPKFYGTVIFGADPRKNILKNGDFSMQLKSGIYYTGKWSSQPPADGEFAGDTRTFISGPQSLRLSGKSIFKGYFSARQFLAELKPNQKYRLSFFIKTAGIETCIRTGGGVVNIWDSNNRWFPSKGLTGDNPWTFQSFEFITPADTNAKKNSCINLFLLQSLGTVWFDDVCLEEIQ